MQAQLSDLPVELLENILSGVPGIFTAICGSVSKSWKSILDLGDFKKLFLTTGYTRRRLLLLTIRAKGQRFFFSSPQSPDGNSSLALTRYRPCPTNFPDTVCSPLEGFITRRVQEVSIVICNPLTAELVSLPELKLMSGVEAIPFLGYDSTDEQLKVLCIGVRALPKSVYGESRE